MNSQADPFSTIVALLSVGLLALLGLSILLGKIGTWRAGRKAQERPVIMSRTIEARLVSPDTDVVHVPVRDTGTPADDSSDDLDMPRLSRRLSDREVITILAVQRKPDGKYRFSANEIYELIGGTRSDVLTQVREIREGPPPAEFHPLTPEQQAARKELGLTRS